MSEVIRKAKLAKQASRSLNNLLGQEKNSALLLMAEALEQNYAAILKANQKDLKVAQKNKMTVSLQDRLKLDQKRIAAMAQGLREVAQLPEPAGRVLSETVRPNGLKIQKVSVPMGVIGIIYEARPNVTADAAALCLKSGSAVILRGGSDAQYSNKAIVTVLREALKKSLITPEAIQLIESIDRKLVTELLGLREYIDLLVPRGGAGLIQKVVNESKVPIIETGIGICHVYVDAAADITKALEIAYNAKVQRPSVCNSMETLLVHKEIADLFMPKIIAKFKAAQVVMHGCLRTKKFDKAILPATTKHYGTEYLGLEVSIKIVDSINEAMEHIYTFGSKHTEVIVTENKKAAQLFTQSIDASTVIVNASTRFTDGGEFGFGCELGISTQKLHARGPMGLAELMSYKYVVTGDGQIRS